MAKKNSRMRQYDGEWNVLHPETNIQQVEDLVPKLTELEAIARGAARALVFDTVAALDAWLTVSANTASLQVGDNLYIKATDVPDYWWDGTKKQVLETEKVVLNTATTSANGLMSAADKTKLNGIATGATKVTSPTDIGAATAAQGAKADTALQEVPFETTASNIKVNGTASAGSSAKAAKADHVHPIDTSRAGTAVATASANGLMSKTDKSKLDSTPTITISATAPTSPKTGDIWYELD